MRLVRHFLSELKRQCREPHIPNWVSVWNGLLGFKFPDQQISLECQPNSNTCPNLVFLYGNQNSLSCSSASLLHSLLFSSFIIIVQSEELKNLWFKQGLVDLGLFTESTGKIGRINVLAFWKKGWNRGENDFLKVTQQINGKEDFWLLVQHLDPTGGRN